MKNMQIETIASNLEYYYILFSIISLHFKKLSLQTIVTESKTNLNSNQYVVLHVQEIFTVQYPVYKNVVK